MKTNEAKLLGLPWDKVEDTLVVTFSGDSNEAKKEFSFNVRPYWGSKSCNLGRENGFQRSI